MTNTNANTENTYLNTQLILRQFALAYDQFPDMRSSLLDSVSVGQIESKSWLVNAIADIDLGVIFLCGGWFAQILYDTRLRYKRCISIDVDAKCELVSKTIHKDLIKDNWKFQAVTANIHNINYEGNRFDVTRADGTTCDLYLVPDTIINTSCEHIDHFSSWWGKIPTGKLVIVQSNDGFDIDGHVNCSKTLDEFAKITPLKTVLFSGEKQMPKFTRFMRIGYK